MDVAQLRRVQYTDLTIINGFNCRVLSSQMHINEFNGIKEVIVDILYLGASVTVLKSF